MDRKNRIRRIFDNIESDVDALVLKNDIQPYFDRSFFYVTGLNKGIFENAMAIVYPDGKTDVAISKLDAITKDSDMTMHTLENKKDLSSIIKKLLHGYKKIGINSRELTHHDYMLIKKNLPSVELVDVSTALLKTRMIKDKEEIKLIKEACRIASMVAERLPDIVSQQGSNASEHDVNVEIDYLLKKNGADHPAFETIVAFGSNSAIPHYIGGNTRLKKGDFMLFDFGAAFERYVSDVSRTFVYGKASTKQKKMYETVHEAQEIGFDCMKEGVTCEEVHRAVKKHIDKSEFKDRFIHSTGHTLGLAVHDGGGLAEGNKDVLAENMIFTVEPGIYLSGLGGVRIEDDVLVKKNGVEILTKNIDRVLREL